MSPRPVTVAARLAAAALLVVGASACGATDSGSDTTTGVAPTGQAVDAVEGQAGSDQGGKVDVKAEINDCLSLTGSDNDAQAKKKDCSDPQANVRVVAKAPDENSCPADVNSVYYETYGDNTRGALCLDYNLRIGDCYVEDPVEGLLVAECTRPGAMKFVANVPGTTDPNSCPDPADTGFPYETRNFIACFQEMTPA